MPVFLRELKGLGVSGVQKFPPTVGIIDGTFTRQPLEEMGRSTPISSVVDN